MAFILRVSSPAFQLNVLGHRLRYVSPLRTEDAILAELKQLAPNVLAAPPSMLRILARRVEQGKLTLSLLQVVSYAEVLYPEDREYLSFAFGCPVYEIYKATEGSIAISCREGSLHINEDLVAVELLDEKGDPVPPGTPSKQTLVTDLHKTSQPIVRYALNDILTVSPQMCSCGSSFRVIEQVQGRADDVFWGARADGRGLQFVFPDYIRRAIVVVGDQIEEYQVTQRSPDAVAVRLQVSEGTESEPLAAAIADGIRRVFQSYDCHPPEVEVMFGAVSASHSSGKLIRIRRAFHV
jgi:putative adenylate-forming enzyme